MKQLLSAILLSAFVMPAIAETQGQRSDSNAIQWYIDHPADRKDAIKRCDANADQTKNDSDCILARKADNQAGVNDVKGGVDNVIQGAADFFHKF